MSASSADGVGRRVVVTGVGPVSAVGVGRDDFFAGLAAGDTGFRALEPGRGGAGAPRTAATIADFSADAHLETTYNYLDRQSELALAAVALAIEDAGLELDERSRPQTGLAFGTAFGSVGTMRQFFAGLLEKGGKFVKPFLFPHTYSNTASSLIAIEFGLNSWHANFASGAVAAAAAIAHGCDLIRHGRVPVMLAGGAEALDDPLLAAFRERSAPLTAGGADDCRPFDTRRNGLVLGEGAGCVTLEDLDHALEREAYVYAEIVGAGAASGPAVEPGAGDGAIRRAMALALADAGLDAGDVAYVSAAANSDPALDRAEATALGSVLGAAAGATPVSAIKSQIGETLGAAGALQLIAAAHAIEAGLLPATANLETPEPEPLLGHILGAAVEEEVETALVNAVDPGGAAVSIIVKRFE